MPRSLWIRAAVVAAVVVAMPARADDPLPSWKDGPSKEAILLFVEKTTLKDSKSFIPPAERIAVFDNDGTLWSEQPLYVQILFAFDRVKALANKHPEWKEKEPFKSVLADDLKGALKSGELGLFSIVTATHTNMTVDEFQETVKDWLATAKHPRFKRPYTELVYQPMLEVLAFLRANGFKTYIVSGGTTEFMRVFAEKTYGIPPEQVIGTTFKTKLDHRDGKPVIFRLPEIEHVDDGAGKPISIQKFIGRRPVMAFGNSDGDFQMLEWTTSGVGPRFGLIVHHTDAEREWAYDRNSHVGKLDKALDEAPKAGWVVADMKAEWKVIYPFQK
ncbi:MAG TPA: HAD family hydrolase [Gemmataceae bacterium]|jgi:phosphoglycolate phosphatase-like HAD superfamily hydrolase|nr:HAD family hydrolase [Gemmataceae bacterium]